jgi:hypothetical protein
MSNMRPALRSSAAATLWLTAGAAIPAALVLPTYLRYGFGGSGGVASNLHFQVVPPDRLLVTLAQFLSFASLEINRFIANDNAKRLTFVMEHWWIAPLALVVLVAGFVQPLWMLASGFRKAPARADWRAVRMLAAFTVVLVYTSYWFVREEPQAHAFYAVAPVAFIYAAECWTLVDRPRWRRVAAVLLACTIAFHAALAITQGPAQSLYANRDVVAAAVRHKQPEMFGHRRPYAPAAGPRALADPSRPYRLDDLKLVEHTVRRATGDVALWTVGVTNTNPHVAFRSLIYAATYANAAGDLVQRHEDVIKDVLQPGETKTFRIPDTIIREPFQDATFEIRAAEALLPIR